jgi:hypothetical protein
VPLMKWSSSCSFLWPLTSVCFLRLAFSSSHCSCKPPQFSPLNIRDKFQTHTKQTNL